MRLIGRKREVEELTRIFESNNPEFVCVFGRRRVGKTFLINKLFSSKYTFKHTALSIINEDTNERITTIDQLNHFKESLSRYGYDGNREISNWFQAFYALEDLLEVSKDERKVVFIDELPWLDTYGSKFVNALESFWNSWANDKNIMLIICGSANAWMTKKMLNNYAGLYNRITKEVELLPFTLKECEEFFQEKNISFSRYDIIQSYMVFGGIPFYLDYIDARYSLPQNIDNIFYRRGAPLRDEFNKLFKSSFKSPELIMKIVKLLFKKSIGYSRTEIIKELNLEEGELTTNLFNALSSSGFITKYRPVTSDRKTMYYKLIDPFCLFYLNFVDNNEVFDENLFEVNYESMKIVSWRGLSFENVCFNHIHQIKEALKISAIGSVFYPFIYIVDGKIESQIDLIIDRKDNIVNLCEMKFYGDEYLLNKEDYFKLLRKGKALSNFLNKKQIIRNTLITTFGLRKNDYSSLYQYVLTINDLFH
ncbi:MAG: AAA family ATPase [Bacilli bacterium]|nr:AAA family ATPase [Bacilli bacterium]